MRSPNLVLQNTARAVTTSMATVDLTSTSCESMDAADELAHVRERFVMPDGTIYLDGNSLGPLPAGVEARVASVITQEWGKDLITSWCATP